MKVRVKEVCLNQAGQQENGGKRDCEVQPGPWKCDLKKFGGKE